MKLVIQIPCLNEAETLPLVLHDLPRSVDGFCSVEVLVIDDGSTDDTAGVAQRLGVSRVLKHRKNKGLAASFEAGLDAAIAMGADVIVNTDGDNQYRGQDIPKLVAPILAGDADVVIGDRQIAASGQFGPLKTVLQRLGSAVVSSLAGVDVPDAVSGFRAISRESAIQLNIVSRFSYTTEMVIQAGNKQMTVASVPVRTNPVLRPPRLFKSTPRFVLEQAVTIIRMYAMYRPLRFFFIIGALISTVGLITIARFIVLYLMEIGGDHLQSVVLGSACLSLGFILFVAGLLSDLVSQNRKLQERTLARVRRLELEYAPLTSDRSAARPEDRAEQDRA